MNSSLDLNLLPLARQAGNVKTELPDLFAVTPPRRTAHGREDDSLIIYLSMAGNSPLDSESQAKLLEQLAQKFYKTTGSVTSALRTVAEELNQNLLDRNLRSTSTGRQGIGQLILVALRADTLYMAQCGAVHGFLVTSNESHHLHDPQSSGRGLGLSRTTPMRFLQVKMGPDDFLVLATLVSPSWTNNSLKHPQRAGIEALRRQLLETGSQDFNAVIIQAQTGTGKLMLLKRKADAPVMGPPGPDQQPSESLASTTNETGASFQPAEDRRLGLPPSMPTAANIGGQPAGVQSQPAPARSRIASQPPIGSDPVTPRFDAFHGETGSPPESISKSTLPSAHPQKNRSASRSLPWAKYLGPLRESLGKIGAAILRAFRSAMGTLGGALLRLLKNLLPDADVLRLPPSMMVFIALAIPLVLATIGGLVFLQRGRAQQHDVYYQKASEGAAYAATLTSPLEQRMAWQTVLGDLNKAEDYTITSQSQALRTQATQNLDNLDSVKRLDYKQAIVGGLDTSVRITRMIATATDLYMLNAEQGNVLRAIMTGRGYEIDPSFQCGPTYGPIDVGPLVDIAELSPGSFENASVLGMDKDGNLLYCVVGSQPYSAAMAPPNTGFGEPGSMTLDRSDLFVLDATVNAVWIFRNLEVRQQPRLFFGDFVPPMEDVIDLAEYNDDLFLLHADGHITKCTYSGLAESPTRCDDPYPYSDNRPGRVHGPVIEEAVFSQIHFSSFPERSIYLLDPQHQSIYYFSVLLNLQWQYQPFEPVAEGKATAFAISPNRMAFLAISNYVYYAAMP